MTFDDRRQRTLLVTRGPLPQLWSWDGTVWERLEDPPGINCGFAYDTTTDRAILFGGCRGTLANANTHAWDGTSWSTVTPAHRPPERFGHSLVFDYRRGELVLFGGSPNNIDFLSDTWVFTGGDWIERTPTRHPVARAGHGAAWNPPRGRVTLFGGHIGLAVVQDTWEWDGAEWHEVTLDLAPESRDVTAIASTSTGILLHGGVIQRLAGEPDVLGDTWELEYEPLVQADVCGARDGDLDGRIGCSDPDCALRCAPVCAPGPGVFDVETGAPNTTCLVDVGRRCGNGTADIGETCHGCPGDFSPAACAAEVRCGDLICEANEASECPGDCPP